VARRRGIDDLRRQRRAEVQADALLARLEPATLPEEALDEDVGDDLLRLIFIAAHPLLSSEARVALTLRLLGGLSTAEIARAYLCPEATIAQRLVRAQRTLSESGSPFEMPQGAERRARLGAVLEVLYLIFNEGYSATRGPDWTRPELCGEALRMGRALAARMPEEPEVHGLLALMELQASRIGARRGPQGEALLLHEQPRARWDGLLIQRGLAGFQRGLNSLNGQPAGPYLLQAAIAACHARARSVEDTDWAVIVAVYDALLRVLPSPVVALNRAVALSQLGHPAEALAEVQALAARLGRYPWLPCVRADLLQRLGRTAEAIEALTEARAMTHNAAELALLTARIARLREA
jgi:predicted RNA polymerase sigma factor